MAKYTKFCSVYCTLSWLLSSPSSRGSLAKERSIAVDRRWRLQHSLLGWEEDSEQRGACNASSSVRQNCIRAYKIHEQKMTTFLPRTFDTWQNTTVSWTFFYVPCKCEQLIFRANSVQCTHTRRTPVTTEVIWKHECICMNGSYCSALVENFSSR